MTWSDGGWRTALAGRALRFRPDLADLIGRNSKRSLSYTEDSVRENRTKHVLNLPQGCPKNEFRECKVIFSLTQSLFLFDIQSHNPALTKSCILNIPTTILFLFKTVKIVIGFSLPCMTINAEKAFSSS